MEKDDKIVAKNKIMATIKHRKNYQSDFKAKVALEAVKGRLTINEISKQFGVHPNQISKWKKQFLESLPQIFDNSKKSPAEQNEELVNQLYQQIGQMKVELDWLKKNLPFSVKVRRSLVEPENKRISISRQCQAFKPGLGNGHYLYQIERRIHLFVGDHGLAFEICD